MSSVVLVQQGDEKLEFFNTGFGRNGSLNQFFELNLEDRRITQVFASIDREENLLDIRRFDWNSKTGGKIVESLQNVFVSNPGLDIPGAVLLVEKRDEKLKILDSGFGRFGSGGQLFELRNQRFAGSNRLGAVQRQEKLCLIRFGEISLHRLSHDINDFTQGRS